MTSTRRPNKFAGTCSCGSAVPAGAGFLGGKVNGRWTTTCRSCTAPVAPARRNVVVWNTGEDCDAVRDAGLVNNWR